MLNTWDVGTRPAEQGEEEEEDEYAGRKRAEEGGGPDTGRTDEWAPADGTERSSVTRIPCLVSSSRAAASSAAPGAADEGNSTLGDGGADDGADDGADGGADGGRRARRSLARFMPSVPANLCQIYRYVRLRRVRVRRVEKKRIVDLSSLSLSLCIRLHT